MLFILALVLIGLVKKQGRRYWMFAAAAVLLQLVLATLLYGAGTLEHPGGDGLITRWVRSATQNGPIMGLWGLFVIAVGWGLPIWLAVRGYERPGAGSVEIAAGSAASTAAE